MPNLNIHNAIIFATLAHQGQVRKGTDIPYIVHPMEVMQILTENECPQYIIIAGILHDTLEDTPITPKEILRHFGQKVLDLVQSESEDKTKSWQERKLSTINRIGKASKAAQLVCCADKLSNIRSIYSDKLEIGDKVFKRFNASKEQIQWYYKNLEKAFTKIDDYKMKHEYIKFVKLVFA